LALILTGWPMLEFGFAWFSYANDDMANYVLDAERMTRTGFLNIPDRSTFLEGLDYTQSYWFLAVDGHRPGSQLLLAWVISLTGKPGFEIFMPVILAFHLVLISAAGALVCQSRRLRLPAIITCLMLSLSTQNSTGVLYQLIAQVGGLGMLAGAA